MKKIILGIVLFFSLLTLWGCQQEQAEEEVTEPSAEESSDNVASESEQDTTTEGETETASEEQAPFFWRVDHEGNTVYLLGSIHIGNEDMYPMAEEVEEAYASADQLVVEANILEADESTMQDAMMANSLYTDGSVLSDHISDEAYQNLTDVLNSYSLEGMTMEQLNIFKPWFVEQLLTELAFMELDTVTTEYGVDYHFLERAVEDNKPILELEGIEEQFNFMIDIPEDIQVEGLEQTVNNWEEAAGPAAFNSLIDAWKTGSEQQLEAAASSSDDIVSNYDTYQAQLLEDRNVNMVEKIERYLTADSEQTYFVIVGALHYIGDAGIDNLLDQDYDIQSYAEILE
ncbi:TraB/GumN family protein [Radiobacillus sp. PE A8.2]|uniref:TraB/GumN family protein n=1 Tax=Radiobacillus sp. PE A8.2 TaxID=3380349 RepID=UPI003891061E